MKEKFLLILFGAFLGASLTVGLRIDTKDSLSCPRDADSQTGFIPPIQGPFILNRQGYSVCYDGRTKNPIWVYEYITPESLIGNAKRSNKFRCDPLIKSHVQSSLDDFKGSGFDRGHLAAAANHKNSPKEMD